VEVRRDDAPRQQAPRRLRHQVPSQTATSSSVVGADRDLVDVRIVALQPDPRQVAAVGCAVGVENDEGLTTEGP